MSSETTYSVEYAKSSRSKCKRCKVQINKGEIRLCVTVHRTEEGAFDMASNHHIPCFKLPRKFASGPSQLSPADFLRDMVEDKSEDHSILTPKTVEKFAAQIEQAASAKSKSTKVRKEDEDSTLMTEIKTMATEENPPSSKKKLKTETTPVPAGTMNKYVDSYLHHHKSKLDDLKDILRWNKQVIGGVKDWVLFKIIDGETHGRLSVCGLCGGRLKLQEGDFQYVHCSGRFDEDNQLRLPCAFQGDRADASIPRLEWLSHEPSEDEKEAMETELEELRDAVDGGGADGTDEAGAPLVKKALQFEWQLSKGKEAIRTATNELVELVFGKVDLPEGKEPKMLLGPMIVSNQDKTPSEIVQLVIDKFGFKMIKEEKKAAKEASLEAQCTEPKNVPLILAFRELAEFYFKEQNRNAGASYQKVVAAIQKLDFEVTAENAMSLSKGKTKVQNIGKGSAEKMKEFCETGTITKLEEKRAAHA